MPDDLGGGLFLVTQDDDIELDEGPVGQVLHDGVPDLVVRVSESVSTLVEDVTELTITTTEQVIQLVDTDPDHRRAHHGAHLR